jgi:imidazole glycerol phosphate synthase subunit HisF
LRGWLEAKKHLKVPVIAVGGLDKPSLAAKLVKEGHADIAAMAAGNLSTRSGRINAGGATGASGPELQ